MEYLQLLLFGTFLIILYKWVFRADNSNSNSPQTPPLAPYCLPLIGHAWVFICMDLKDFLDYCYKKFGKGEIFEIRLFNKRWFYITDQRHVRDYFRAPEEQLSLFSLFDIDNSFGCASFDFSKVIKVLRHGFSIASEGYLEQVEANLRNHIKLLKEGVKLGSKNQTLLFKQIVRRFIDTSTAAVLLEIDLDEEGLNVFRDFESFYHLCVGAELFLPQKFVDFVTGWRMRRLRQGIVKYVLRKYGEVEKDKKESRLLRTAFNMVEEDSAEASAGDKELEGIIGMVMVGGSENSASQIVNMITDLEKHPEHLARLLEELELLVATKDINGILKAPFLDACFNESSRLAMGVFSFQRKAVKDFIFGSFTVPKDSVVNLAVPTLQVCGKDAELEFVNSQSFDPTRFLNQKDHHLLTFGNLRHYCPAKGFSLHLVKLAVAYLITSFKFELLDYGKLDYMAFGTFAERKFKCDITQR